jgi:aspartyl-tRNA(Asn)/glutamyl-tRNA(Gln) amidotransferase subunit C
MKITEQEVRETAALARLELSDAEVARMRRDLDAILTYMEKLAAIDVTDVEPLTAVHAVTNSMPLRDDQIGPHLGTEEALAAAPHREDGFFVVPRIIDKDKGKEAG